MPRISVFSAETTEILRAHLRSRALLEEFNEDTAKDLGVRRVETGYEINPDAPNLEMPQGFAQAENNDAKNIGHIIKILPNLTPANATDERLWVTLALLNFKDYTLQRWPFERMTAATEEKHIKLHWFANGIRGRTRDNAIGRLWWTGYTASRLSKNEAEETDEESFSHAAESLLFNSDFRSSILERNTTFNSTEVAAAVLTITRTHPAPYNRSAFRSFVKEVNLLGGRTNYAAMDMAQLLDLLSPIYDEAYSTYI